MNLKIVLSGVCCFVGFSFLFMSTNISLGQSQERIFISPESELTLIYPDDWNFTEGEREPNPEPGDSIYYVEFCLSEDIDTKYQICKTDSTVDLSVNIYKLNDGTSMKQFYEQRSSGMKEVKAIVGSSKNLEIKTIKISGLPAIQTISTHSGSGGSLGKLLKMIGSEGPTSKDVNVYTVNGTKGYQISAGTHDESDFDTYYPTLQKMISSIKIKGAIGTQENLGFVAPNITAPYADVVLLSQKLKKSTGGFNRIVGEVKNVGDDEVQFVKIGLTTYDPNGDVVGTDSTYATSHTLKSNQRSSFDLLSSKDNFQGMKSYQLSLQWRDSTGEDQYVEDAKVYRNGTSPSSN